MGSLTQEIDFVPIDGSVSSSKPSNSFRVISWNTLADQYTHYQSAARPVSDSSVFDKTYRHPQLGEIFQHFVDLDVDFVCLQEVDFKVARETLVVRNSYTRLLTPTGHGRGDTRVDACCIFYKSSRWQLVGDYEVVNFNDLAGPNPSSTFETSFKKGNYAIMACFQHKRIPDMTVIVCNSHLHWNPQIEYVKLCQAHYLCLRTKTFLEKMRGIVVPHPALIFCGDLNSQTGGLVHAYFSKGEVDITPRPIHRGETGRSRNRNSGVESQDWNAKAAVWLSQSNLECPLREFTFESAYAKFGSDGHTEGEDLGFTNSTADFCGIIDYIFFGSLTLNQTKRLSTPIGGYSCDARPLILPTRTWPSDHIAIGGEFIVLE